MVIQERQYQFENKRAKYENFFRMLDQFESDNLVRIKQTIYPILSEFQKNYIQALNYCNKKNADNAIKVVSKRLQRIALDAQKDLFKIKEEMNVIRLIASPAGLEKIDEISSTYDDYMEAFNTMMIEFIPSLLSQKNKKIEEYEECVDEAAKAIHPIKEVFINLTRMEICAA